VNFKLTYCLTAPRVAVGARYVRQCEFAAAYA